ncbi:MAG: metallophosphoesterase [Methanothrix sp.]|nr:metallophosphoesterase [Methanothrix sp.]
MTRIIALSDTHLKDEELPLAVARLARGADIILHAGDFVSVQAHTALADLGRLEAVRGNADHAELKRLLPERRVIEVEGIRIGLVHMASHGSSLVGAKMMAREMNVQVLVFGHIHRPIVERGERLLICPGSSTLPRMSAPSVAELEIEGASISGSIIPLGSPVCNYLKFAQSLAKKFEEKN